MNKLNYSDIQDLQLIDIRSQQAFQTGHAKGSLNLNPSNFKKYAQYFLTPDQDIVFVIDEENDLEELSSDAQTLGFSQIKGYVLAAEIPAADIQTIETIAAEAFLKNEGDYTLLDVRHPDEITRSAPEKNLVNIPFEDLPEKASFLDISNPIYTLCGSGNRGTAAASYLIQKGFRPIVIEGGMKAVQSVTP